MTFGSSRTTATGWDPNIRASAAMRGERDALAALGIWPRAASIPAHQMTTGEGGAVYTSDEELATIAESFRDWGRDCYCQPGRSNTCGKRFGWCLGTLPEGYDHKYTYSHFGYNLKMTDMQAAVGVSQLKKLPSFVAARRSNFDAFYRRLSRFKEVLRLPEATPRSTPSWFGFLIVVQPGSGVTRDSLVEALEKARVQTRMLFAGNLVRQPCFDEMRESGSGFRVVGRFEQYRPADERRVLVWRLSRDDGSPRRSHLQYDREASGRARHRLTGTAPEPTNVSDTHIANPIVGQRARQ